MKGIYRIRNTINDKCYYGSSKNIERRFKRHLNELKKNKHHNVLLQRAWLKYGETNFSFDVIEECSEDNLLILEQKYLDLKPEYNIAITASGGDNISENPNKDQIICNIKKGFNKWFGNLTELEIKEKFSRPKDKNPNWKGGTSVKFCECGAEISPINNSCIKCRDKSGVNNPFYGKNHSKEYKENASKRQKGKYNGTQNIPIMINNVEYSSAGEASKILDIPMVTIRWRVKSKSNKFINYQYKASF